MEQSIQKITDAIYLEGRDKGQAEADRLIAEARQQAEALVAEARAKAEEIEREARKAAAELEANTKSELKMYAAQAINALKSEITTVVNGSITSEAVGKLTADKDFLGKFMVELAGKWAANEPIVISTADADALKTYFAANAKNLLDKGVTINKVHGKETLFSIAPADGAYKVNFGAAEFENYFKEFLRPQLIEMLF